MKHIQRITIHILFAIICIILCRCSNEYSFDFDHNKKQAEDAYYTMELFFNGEIVDYNNQSTRQRAQKGSTSSWNDGDKIYITFFNGDTIIPGEATYQSSKWSINVYGNLPIGSFQKCEARFFVDPEFVSSTLVKLTYKTAIFEDISASYSYDGESLSVQAQLKPKTGRLYFTGEPNTNINIMGLAVLTSFSVVNNSFSTSTQLLSTSVSSEGSTPYIYATFSDSERKIGLIGSDYAYTRACSSEILSPGESGYMAIPTESVHNKWNYGLSVKASGVEFKMIPVPGYSGGFFLIGETEVTEALYNSVIGKTSNSLLPKSNIACNAVLTFIEKLSNNTKLSFALPTADQWKYAAKGGKLSQGYSYSGSDIPDDVAWYSANASSKQNVKTKAPNELGIYDMSGNVAEFTEIKLCSGYNDMYSFKICGGSYENQSTGILSTSYISYGSETSSNSSSETRGFRLVLTCP